MNFQTAFHLIDTDWKIVYKTYPGAELGKSENISNVICAYVACTMQSNAQHAICEKQMNAACGIDE